MVLNHCYIPVILDLKLLFLSLAEKLKLILIEMLKLEPESVQKSK